MIIKYENEIILECDHAIYDGKDLSVFDESGNEIGKMLDFNIDSFDYVDKNITVTNGYRICELKKLLEDTDYVVIKIAEGSATLEEYADIIAQRQEWRREINELEQEVNNDI